MPTGTPFIFSPVRLAAPTPRRAKAGLWLPGSLGAGDLPPLRPAWRLAGISVVHQLCGGLESPHSSAKSVGPVSRRGQDWGMEVGGPWPGWPIWE